MLRQALASLDPRPSREGLSVSTSLHKQLAAFGLMYDFFSDRFNNNIPDENGRVRAFDPGKVLMGSLDRGELAIPIFMKFFRRSTTPKDCSVCAESLYEINFGSEEQWRQACEGYYGSWMSRVLLFPTREVLHCDHDMDMCKGCLETQLSTQLEQFGRNACGRLTCPRCNRVLSESEVRSFGSEETVQTYVSHNIATRDDLLTNLFHTPAMNTTSSSTISLLTPTSDGASATPARTVNSTKTQSTWIRTSFATSALSRCASRIRYPGTKACRAISTTASASMVILNISRRRAG